MYGIRGVWGGVSYDWGVGMVPHMEYLPRSGLGSMEVP